MSCTAYITPLLLNRSTAPTPFTDYFLNARRALKSFTKRPSRKRRPLYISSSTLFLPRNFCVTTASNLRSGTLYCVQTTEDHGLNSASDIVCDDIVSKNDPVRKCIARNGIVHNVIVHKDDVLKGKVRNVAFAQNEICNDDNIRPNCEKTEEQLFEAAQRLRVRRERSILRIRAYRPIWTYIVIVINVSILVLQRVYILFGRGHTASVIPNLQLLGAKISTKVVAGELWRLVTAAFLHVNVGHLLMNSYALYALGSATEILFGSAAFVALYFGGALGGNVASVCASIRSSRPSVGSSGGVFALIAAMCVHLERNRTAIGPMARGNLRAVVMATGVNLAGGWIMPSVDGWAHFGGCLFGVAMAMVVAPTVVLHRAQDGRLSFVEVRRIGTWACWVVWVVVVTISIAVVVGLRVATP